MADIDKENLEKAINSNQQNNQNPQPQQQNPQQNPQQQGKQMSKEMEIGFHQGALNTLNKERSELVKMAQNVEAIMQMHVQRLKELGVNIKLQGQENSQQPQGSQNNQQSQQQSNQEQGQPQSQQ